jgi:hypothetical protein
MTWPHGALLNGTGRDGLVLEKVFQVLSGLGALGVASAIDGHSKFLAAGVLAFCRWHHRWPR